MIDQIEELDKKLFLFLNGLNTPFLDVIMYWVSNKFFWIPLYIFLFIIIGKKVGWKVLLLIIPLIAIIITLTDQLSVQLFKEVFKRYRPCHNEEIKHMVHTVDGCGGQYGFISSHAINVFALAVFIGMILREKISLVLPLVLLWAFIVSYSRIYSGAHYPTDVLVGSLVGIIAGWLGYKLYKWLSVKFYKI